MKNLSDNQSHDQALNTAILVGLVPLAAFYMFNACDIRLRHKLIILLIWASFIFTCYFCNSSIYQIVYECIIFSLFLNSPTYVFASKGVRREEKNLLALISVLLVVFLLVFIGYFRISQILNSTATFFWMSLVYIAWTYLLISIRYRSNSINDIDSCLDLRKDTSDSKTVIDKVDSSDALLPGHVDATDYSSLNQSLSNDFDAGHN
ncbi:hypothetical protein [Parvibium lacunae]|uniref:hypothetical protein n=1 Tax=Parvibium lacunae TaxID=1888893 RepID=UPI0011C07716|nr:hypothetical protein [Parvibium lacunae]